MLFLVRLEHDDAYITTHLIKAEDEIEAYDILDKWLEQDYTERNGNWYIDPKYGDKIKIECVVKINTIEDLEELIPIIEMD